MIFAADCNRTDVLSYLLSYDTTKAKAVQAMKKALLNDDSYFRTAVLPNFKRAGFPRTHHINVDDIKNDDAVAAAIALYDNDEAADDSGYESDELCMFHRIWSPIPRG
ncbi:hypothetical protein SDRG_12721 [Saprolegnia diclina VS20]|uniref:Uncharacterized protein n=1 Tax=Saprolegnia diclina (strain VS20) TaxID=1156394 RepID=T0RBE6_SAPDV|nr:hypothetical protein SDRG_12721 [Saprolegnia diclina VS20]EQC29473.1 hypothetical protein SDRG_12721 [Saprolegnia diclina VS20]|eukprot:XP_008617025.1 hypothetical protein SDRG_12721 [Saprolegnia diclina VS20]